MISKRPLFRPCITHGAWHGSYVIVKYNIKFYEINDFQRKTKKKNPKKEFHIHTFTLMGSQLTEIIHDNNILIHDS